MRHVVFRLCSELYGLPLAAVREIVELTPCSRVPRAPPHVRGIMNVRGRVVTVVDLASLLGLTPAALFPSPGGKVVLLDRGRRDLGLRVAEVVGIHALKTMSLAPGEATAAIRGIAQGPHGAVTVLDAEGVEKQVVSLLRSRTAAPAARA